MKKSVGQTIREHLRSVFLAGLLLLVPLVFTYLILKSLFLWMDGFAQPVAQRLWGISFPGLGIVLSLLFLYGVGLVTANIVGRALVHQGEQILLKIPLVKAIYQSFKEFLQIFLGGTAGLFRGRVVLVEYPKKGFKTLAFLTNSWKGPRGEQKSLVLVPTVPNPTSGALAIFPADEVTLTHWTLEEASKFFLSAGILGLEKEKKPS